MVNHQFPCFKKVLYLCLFGLFRIPHFGTNPKKTDRQVNAPLCLGFGTDTFCFNPGESLRMPFWKPRAYFCDIYGNFELDARTNASRSSQLILDNPPLAVIHGRSCESIILHAHGKGLHCMARASRHKHLWCRTQKHLLSSVSQVSFQTNQIKTDPMCCE